MAIYVPSRGAEDWAVLLAEPEKHWRTGRSAKALAHSWQSANGLPPEIAALVHPEAKLLIGLPEHKVPLPGGSRPSQTDLFALVRVGAETMALAVEGKVDESFGPTIGEWLDAASEGKQDRLAFLHETLGVAAPAAPDLRYQLFHRTASAVIEAERFKTDRAGMIVHSFSRSGDGFEDFAAFVSLFGADAARDKAVEVVLPTGKPLLLGWATGNARFLAA